MINVAGRTIGCLALSLIAWVQGGANLLNAAIVVTPVEAMVTPGVGFWDVSVNVYGRWDGVGTLGSDDRVGDFAVQANITTTGPGTINVQSITPVAMIPEHTTSWAGLNNVGRFSSSATQLTFGARGQSPGGSAIAPPVNMAIANTGPSASTFIGNFVYRVSTPGTYTVAFSSPNSSFARVQAIGPDILLAESFNSLSTVVAVPEPSSLLLTLLAPVAYGWHRRRKSQPAVAV